MRSIPARYSCSPTRATRFAIAEAVLGYSLNTEDPDELQAAADLLMEQKPLVMRYVMDQIYDYMDNEEAWIAPYYAGDCMLMMQENPDLAFYLPETQTFNTFIDAMCIPPAPSTRMRPSSSSTSSASPR